MISVTKVFRFEAAHAILNYPGSCANIHGHSYELHVTIRSKENPDSYIEGTGILMDFKGLKSIVQLSAIQLLDHKLILSAHYLNEKWNNPITDEIVIFEVEPTAENLLFFLRDRITENLPEPFQLASLKLWETRDSYAEWSAL